MAIIPRSDSPSRIQIDHLDRLPDSILVLVLNKIADVKSLGRCSLVSRRFRSLVPHVENVVVRVDCVISSSSAASSSSFSAVFNLVVGGIVKPLQALGQLLGTTSRSSSSSMSGEIEQGGGVTHHSPTQVLRNFEELPSGELGLDDGVLLKWRAEFGSTLDTCLILGASSVMQMPQILDPPEAEDNGSIPESFYTNGGLKLRVVWTISSLIAASARHYLLQPIIAEHKTLKSLVLTDSDGQGVLCMNKDQLEELRVKPLSASKRTLVPALNMRLWYAPSLELPDGTVLKGATLVAIRPSESTKDVCDVNWVSSAFEEPYETAAKMLVKRRTYCLEMNSF